MKLYIACLHLRLVGQRHPDHVQPQVIGQQIGGLCLKRIHGRHDKPHLIEPRLLEQVPGQRDVATMDGVKRTAEETDTTIHAINGP